MGRKDVTKVINNCYRSESPKVFTTQLIEP